MSGPRDHSAALISTWAPGYKTQVLAFPLLYWSITVVGDNPPGHVLVGIQTVAMLAAVRKLAPPIARWRTAEKAISFGRQIHGGPHMIGSDSRELHEMFMPKLLMTWFCDITRGYS